jgi:Na+/H+ antiporter NhaD/arsenite permease-like protein
MRESLGMRLSRLCFYLCLFFTFAVLFFCNSETLYAAQGIGISEEAARMASKTAINLPPIGLVAPFIALLLMIATGPLLYHRFWDRYYPVISLGFGLIVVGYYSLLMEQGIHILEHTLEEYLSFIALISSLFVVSGGILIKIERRGSPLVNSLLLIFGALVSNFIGTTGASMLLVRPYMRINEGRLKAFHIVFFIFIVSNIGGGLTPIGDPPLFLGFLKGVPFFWVLPKIWLPWLFSLISLLLIFIVLDARVGKSILTGTEAKNRVRIKGYKNFFYLAVIVLSVFLDPAVIEGFPSLQNMLHLPLGIRELIMFGVAIAAYKTADVEVLKRNEFNFEPIKEVAFLFLGIFATMIPALELIGHYAETHAGEFSVSRFYWMTGTLSGVLDNAPTYLNFFSGALGKFGLDIASPADIKKFAEGLNSPIKGDVHSDIYLMAISVASVFFGAMTYIGNAPNFMVKNIAAQSEVDVPDFLEYIYKYSLPVLLPILLVLWLLFFNY